MAPALFMPVFSGYVLGLFMIGLAVWSKFAFRSHTDLALYRDFRLALAPISRGALWFMFCLVVASIGSALLSTNENLRILVKGLGHFFVKYGILWFVYLTFWWRVAQDRSNWRIFSFAYAFFAVVNAIYCLAQRYTGIDWAHGFDAVLGANRYAYGVYRFGGFMGHPLSLGYSQVLAFVAAIHFAGISPRGKEKIAWLTSALCASFVLLISGSRGPQAAALIGGFLMIPLSVWRTRWKSLTIGFSGLALAAGVFGVFNRFLEVMAAGSGGDMRMIHWSVHWQIFAEHLWFGLGLGEPRSAISAHYLAKGASDKLMLAHNAFLQCAADFGLLGLLGLGVWLTSWLRAARGLQRAGKSLTIVFIVAVLSGLTQNNLQESAYILALTTWTMIIIAVEVSGRDHPISTKNKGIVS